MTLPPPLSWPKQFHFAANPWRQRETGISGQQSDAQCFGEGDIDGVVDGQIVAQFPTSPQERTMWGAVQPDGAEVCECQLDAPIVQIAGGG